MKAVLGMMGVIFFVFGGIWTIALAVSSQYITGLFLAGAAIIAGLLLIAWAFFGDEHETHRKEYS